LGVIVTNNQGNVSIIAIYILSLIGLGGLYTLFFLEFAIPNLAPHIPAVFDTYKTVILMFLWGIPFFITFIFSLAVLKNALKRHELGGF